MAAGLQTNWQLNNFQHSLSVTHTCTCMRIHMHVVTHMYIHVHTHAHTHSHMSLEEIEKQTIPRDSDAFRIFQVEFPLSFPSWFCPSQQKKMCTAGCEGTLCSECWLGSFSVRGLPRWEKMGKWKKRLSREKRESNSEPLSKRRDLGCRQISAALLPLS